MTTKPFKVTFQSNVKNILKVITVEKNLTSGWKKTSQIDIRDKLALSTFSLKWVELQQDPKIVDSVQIR